MLSTHLGMSTTELMPLLTKPGTRFVYVKKKVPALTYTALATELAKRKIYGVFRENDPIRTYPNSSVGSSVVGFVGADGKGLAGLELKMNASLAGVEGKQTFQSAPNGSKIPLGESSMTPAQNGISYQLTLDSEIEWAAQRRVARMVREDAGRLRFRHRARHQDRPGPGPGPRTELRLGPSAGGEAGRPRKPGRSRPPMSRAACRRSSPRPHSSTPAPPPRRPGSWCPTGSPPAGSRSRTTSPTTSSATTCAV